MSHLTPISSPATAPESDFEVRGIFQTMTFGSPEVAWQLWRKRKSVLIRLDFLSDRTYLWMTWFLSRGLESLWCELDFFEACFPPECLFDVLRFWLDHLFCLDLFHDVGENVFEHDVFLNDVFGWGCCHEEWYEFLIVNDCQVCKISSHHSMKDGLKPSNEVGWTILELSRWSCEKIVFVVPSLRWWFHFIPWSFPGDDDDVAIVVFDVTNHLISLLTPDDCLVDLLCYHVKMTNNTWSGNENDPS